MLGELDSAESDGEAGKYWIFGLNLMEGRLPRRDASVTGTGVILRGGLALSCPTVVLQCLIGFSD
jgi:hypothetical protein